MDEAERCNILGLMDSGNLVALGTPDELKEGLLADFYEVSSSFVLESHDRLLSLDFVSQFALFGDKIHIVTDKRKEALTKNDLQEVGVDLTEITRIRPSLEDVFIYHMMAEAKSSTLYLKPYTVFSYVFKTNTDNHEG